MTETEIKNRIRAFLETPYGYAHEPTVEKLYKLIYESKEEPCSKK